MAATKTAVRAQLRNPNPMSPFIWQGTDKRGKVMKGEQLAKNANLLKAELRKQGITPTVVKAKPKPLFGSAGKKITAKDIAIFSRMFATMMQAGVPMVQAVEIIASGQKKCRATSSMVIVSASPTPVRARASRAAHTDCASTWPVALSTRPCRTKRGSPFGASACNDAIPAMAWMTWS